MQIHYHPVCAKPETSYRLTVYRERIVEYTRVWQQVELVAAESFEPKLL